MGEKYLRILRLNVGKQGGQPNESGIETSRPIEVIANQTIGEITNRKMLLAS